MIRKHFLATKPQLPLLFCLFAVSTLARPAIADGISATEILEEPLDHVISDLGYRPEGDEPKKPLLARVVADFNNDGAEDVAYAEMIMCGNSGCPIWLFLRDDKGKRYRMHHIFSHVGMLRTEPVSAGSAKLMVCFRPEGVTWQVKGFEMRATVGTVAATSNTYRRSIAPYPSTSRRRSVRGTRKPPQRNNRDPVM